MVLHPLSFAILLSGGLRIAQTALIGHSASSNTAAWAIATRHWMGCPMTPGTRHEYSKRAWIYPPPSLRT